MLAAKWTGCFGLLCASTLCLAQRPVPAFLDARNQVRVSVSRPLDASELAGRFTVTVGNSRIAVVKAEPEIGTDAAPNDGRIVLAGTLQAALGANEWDPNGESTRMAEDAPNIFDLIIRLPKGRYEYKVARNGSWAENYGVGFVPNGQNIAIVVPQDGLVKFVVDMNSRTILNSIDNPDRVPTPTAVPPRTKPAPPSRSSVVLLTLARNVLPSEVSGKMTVQETGSALRPLIARDALNDAAFRYSGNDLGSRWSKTATTFKVWSPVSRCAEVLIFAKATSGTPKAIRMKPTANGVWQATVSGDLHGWFYQYRFVSYGETRIAADINCFAASEVSTRSMVVDLSRTNPVASNKPPVHRRDGQTTILYELHVRDFTIRPDSGVDAAKRGKYAGMAQPGTHVPGSAFRTGLDYLTSLGVTDVHLLPVQDGLNTRREPYTWGYATTLFNVPEESYSMTPTNPVGVIREFKGMVAGMHQAGLRVVMDVVYNHTWPPQGTASAFWQTVPYYYFRTDAAGHLLNESGVGNALADERPMVRKFVRDSLLYWLCEYKVDGFRFDLLGMHTPDSVRDWVKAMRAVRPDVTLYGEPWTGGGSTRFPKGAQRGVGIAVFNDRFRNIFRGDLDGTTPGFLTGGGGDVDTLQLAIRGSTGQGGFANSPLESINYVSAHDNMTLTDRIAASMPANKPHLRVAALRFSIATVLLSRGIPFWEGGAEIGRTKGGANNTYNAGDAINAYDWTRAIAYSGVRSYFAKLTALRQVNKEFWPANTAPLRYLPEKSLPSKTIGYQLGDRLLVILHGDTSPASLRVPKGKWTVILGGSNVSHGGDLALQPLTAYVLKLAR